MHLLSKLHARLGDFWWYSLLLFAALRCGDLINAFVGLWLVPKYVSPEELGAVLPLMSFSTFIGFPMAVLMIVFSRYIVRFHARNDHGRMKSAIYWFIGLAVALNVGSGLLAVFAMPGFFDRIRVVKGSLGVLILAAGLLGAISPVFTRALQGLKEFHAITFLNLAQLGIVRMDKETISEHRQALIGDHQTIRNHFLRLLHHRRNRIHTSL